MSAPLIETPVEQTQITPGVAEALRNRQRRVLLAELLDRDEPASPSALRDGVHARQTDLEEETVELRLHHVHLPILEDAGLVETGDETVALAEHPLFEHEAIDADGLTAERGWEALAAIASEPHRTHLVDVAVTADGPVPLKQLAALVNGRIDGAAPGVDRLRTAFHHVDLPRLADAGVLTYDRDEQLISATDAPPALSLLRHDA